MTEFKFKEGDFVRFKTRFRVVESDGTIHNGERYGYGRVAEVLGFYSVEYAVRGIGPDEISARFGEALLEHVSPLEALALQAEGVG